MFSYNDYVTVFMCYRLYFSNGNTIYQRELVGPGFDPLQEEQDIILPEHLLVYKVR